MIHGGGGARVSVYNPWAVLPPAPAAEREAVAYLLTRNEGRDFCARVQLPETPVVIGRSSRASIRIQDRSVSKIHAALEPVPGSNHFRLRDLGSRNGILFHGKRLKEVELFPGDEVQIGNVYLTLCGDAPTPPADPTPTGPASDPPAPAPARDARARRAAPGWTMVLSKTERVLLAAFLLLSTALAVALWTLPRAAKQDAAPSPNPPPKIAPDGDAAVAGPPAPATSVPISVEIPCADWLPLGRDLDRLCAESGCHLSTAAVEFHVARADEPGRFESNLLALRARGLVRTTPQGAELSPFGTARPHTLAIPLALSTEALAAVPWIGRVPGRLLERDSARPAYESLDDVPAAEIAALRRTWALRFRRAPTVEEILAHRGRNGLDGCLLDETHSQSAISGGDIALASLWVALWGRAPSGDEAACLEAIVRAPVSWADLRPHLVPYLVQGPRVPWPARGRTSMAAWVRGVVRYCLGSELDASAVEEIAERLDAGTLRPALVFEECALAAGWCSGDDAAPPPPRDAAGAHAPPTLRIDLYCNFPVRPLLREPVRLPRLWKRLETALLTIFPVEPHTLPSLWQAMLAASRNQEALVASHLGLIGGWLPDGRGEPRALLADGLFVPALRRLTDIVGRTHLEEPPRGSRPWVRQRLAIELVDSASRGEPAVAAAQVLQYGGFHLLGAGGEGTVYRPPARTLLLAGAALAHTPDEPMAVLASLAEPPAPNGSGAWDELFATLELLALEQPQRRFDVWLWGRAEGGAAELVRIEWGPDIKRGFVHYSTQPATCYHPRLSRLAPDGSEDDPSASDDDAVPAGDAEEKR